MPFHCWPCYHRIYTSYTIYKSIAGLLFLRPNGDRQIIPAECFRQFIRLIREEVREGGNRLEIKTILTECLQTYMQFLIQTIV